MSNDRYHPSRSSVKTGGYTVNGLNQYTAIGGKSINHDANGNLTADGENSYSYDVENRLTSVSGAHNASLSYDPKGRLYKVNPTNGAATYFLYSGDSVIAEYQNGQITHRYVHHDGRGLAPQISYQGSGTSASNRRFLHTNHQGSVIALSDNGGSVTAANRYDEYGVPDAGNTGRFGYTGQMWLPEVGLYHYRARVYKPEIGRFLQTDPIGYEDQMNLYAYVGNDPLNLVDPTGEFATLPLGAFGALVGGIAGATSAAINGGSLKEVAASALAGAVVGGVTGLTAGTVSAGSALSVSAFAAAGATGGIASASGEAIGQVASNGGDISKIDIKKVGFSGILGVVSGQAGAITQAATGSAKTAIKTGALVDVVLSPGVANAEDPVESDTDASSQMVCEDSGDAC